MPKTTKTSKKGTSSKKGTQKIEDWFEASENIVSLCGKVKRIIFENDKVTKFSMDCVSKTEKGNYAHSFITCIKFESVDYEIVEDELIKLEGYIQTTSYNGTYSTQVVATSIDEVEEVPFN